MSASTSGVATPAEDVVGPGLRKLKILMLHGEQFLAALLSLLALCFLLSYFSIN
jgi:hypothetical protein